MRLREIYRYEVAYRLTSPATWGYVIFLMLLASWLFGATTDGGPRDIINAPDRIAGLCAIIGSVGMVVTAALFGDAAIRDAQSQMDPLIYTTPVSKAEYLGGRFLGALTVNALLLLAVPVAVLLITEIIRSMSPAEVGPFRLMAFVQPYVVFILPNVILAGAVCFGIGVLARSLVPVFLGAIGLFITTLVALGFLQNNSHPVLSVVGDPLGIMTLQRVTALWTVVERNRNLIGLPTELLINRAVWLGVALLLLAALHQRFRFAHAAAGGGRQGAADRGSEELEGLAPVAVPKVTGHFAGGILWRQVRAVTGRALSEIVGSRAFLITLVACVGLALLFTWNVSETVFDTSTWPVTTLVAGTGIAQRTLPVLALLIGVFAGELVWRDRDAGEHEIADALPVSGAAALIGRSLALLVMIVLWLTALMLGGLLVQTLQGYHTYEIGLYLRIIFGVMLANAALFAALAMTVHVVANHKYLGHIVLAALFVSLQLLRMLGLVNHRLLLYGGDPGWTHSGMNGFGPFTAPFVWFKLYWAGWALLLLVVATVAWMRGRETGGRARWHAARARWSGSVVRVAAMAAVLILALGGFVFYNTNVLNAYVSPANEGALEAEYERRYRQHLTLPQPTIERADLRIEIYPEQPAVEVRGSFHLVNRTAAPIGAVHVYLDPSMTATSLAVGSATTPEHHDAEVGYRIYALTSPLLPGDSTTLDFDLAYTPRGFPNEGPQTDVVGNGTTINRRMMPFVGYQPIFELTGIDARKRFDLPERAPVPSADDAAALQWRQAVRDADLVHVSAVIGTPADQIAVTPGILRRSWDENGRRYVHYETETPAAFGASVYAARYAVVEDRWEDVTLQVYHHPAHRATVPSMMHGMKAALAHFSRQYGRYPEPVMRLVEFPAYGGFGIAHPLTIAFSESAFLSRVQGNEVDQAFYGTAHEVSHQWWGGVVRGASVEGYGFLTESLANYSAMRLMKHTFGPDVARRVYDFQRDRYFAGRGTQAREVPVLDVTEQAYLAYRKGAVVLYALAEEIGEDRVDAALRRYYERFRDAGPPYPTSRDLYAELQAATPDSLQQWLADRFEHVTLWGLTTDRVLVMPQPDGTFEVRLTVSAKKMRADADGAETDVPMDEWVEIGVFGPPQDGEPAAELYLRRHRLVSGSQVITVRVAQEPVRVGVDPYHRLLDRYRDDNFVKSGDFERGTP